MRAHHDFVFRAQEIIQSYNFASVFDIGCSNGAATQFMKRPNNYVLGIDASATAIAGAREIFPDIDFRQVNASLIDLDAIGHFELISFRATLAYLANWRDLLEAAARNCDYCVVAEHIPPNPAGVVKSIGEMVREFSRNFEIITKTEIDDEVVILLGERMR